MGYTSENKIKLLLAQSMTTATDTNLSTLKRLIDIGSEINGNVINDEIINQYIIWADEEINSSLNVIYNVPLCENVDFESKIIADIDDYNQALIISRSCPFNVLDNILLVDSDGDFERHEIGEILDHNAFLTVDSISGFFEANTTRILRLKFPDPIPFIATRLACANIYDKFFSAQSAPNISEYGKSLRNKAIDSMNNILNGRTVLHGQHRIGTPFINPYLKRRYGIEADSRFGERNIDKSD